MTRKDFVLIAEAVAQTVELDEAGFTRGEIALLNALVDNLANGLRTTNGAFDRARFVKACGVPVPAGKTPLAVCERVEREAAEAVTR